MVSEDEDGSSDSSSSLIQLREIEKKAKRKARKHRATKAVSDLLNVGNNDHPGVPIVIAPFTGENYLSWSRSIRNALTEKSEQGFVDGSIECPSDEEDRVRWVKEDSLVRTWILNLLSKEIKEDFVHTETTLELWEGLKRRYQVNNEHTSYQLQKDINSLKQGNSTLEKYFSQMSRWWDEFTCINPLPRCDCNIRVNKCCIISDQVEAQDVKKRLAQFLAGLNDSYDDVRSQILVTEMLPLDINRTYSFLLSVQKQRGDFSAMPFPDRESDAYKGIAGNKGNSLNEQKNSKGNAFKSSLVCLHCNMTGHLQEGCFKLIGYPEWFKRGKEGKGKKFSNMTATHYCLKENKPKQEKNQKMSDEAFFKETMDVLNSLMKRNGNSEASTSKTIKLEKEVGETRNWLEELPRDVTVAILQKVGAIDILDNVQNVCTSWHEICQDPALWRSIDMCNLHHDYVPYKILRIIKQAIDRSCGQLIDINLEHYCNDDILKYITDRKNQLRRLKLVSCFEITDHGLSEAAKKMSSLEELHLHSGYITEVGLENVGRSCPGLKSLTHNRQRAPISLESDVGDYFDPDSDDGYHIDPNSEALAISRTMPQLRHLSLIGNCMTNTGLQAILDACPDLESLDLRKCIKLDLSGELGKKCSSIKTFHHPNEFVSDYDSESTFDEGGLFYDLYDDYSDGFSGFCLDSDGEDDYNYYASYDTGCFSDYESFFY